MRNYFTFGNFDSRDFGVYISGEGAYNAPARVYNAISVPGRNGDLLIDEHKYENISVTYPAFIAGKNYRTNMAAFRSAMLSVSGYARLADTYHLDEYRLAYFSEAITVKAASQNNAGKFDIVFNCKPQRFLLSGETSVTLTGNGSVENPTLFESKPLIRVNFSESSELIVPPYYNTSPFVSNGVEYTINQDGSITANGTSTSRSYFTLKYLNGTLSPGTYHLSGCPLGGTSTSYRLCVWLRSKGGVSMGSFYEYGNGLDFTITSAQAGYEWIAQIYVESGTTVNNLTFAPSLIATDSVQTCLLGVGSNQIRLNNVFPYIDIDSETENCICGLENANAQVDFTNKEFPLLQPGSTGIALSSGISSVEITPRWYRL